jgi:hypothetical protein
MGLDMYLSKKTYVQQWDHQKAEQKYEVVVTKGGEPTNINPKRVKYIIEEAGYWRKANAIHKWFVDNIQSGNDNCGTYYVERDKLYELLETCQMVKENNLKAEELLPTQSGFFFGDTDYNEWYFKDIDNTIEILEECLADETAYDFEYNSSW